MFWTGEAETLNELAKIYADKPAYVIPGVPTPPALPAIPESLLNVDPAAKKAAGDILCSQTILFAKYSCDLAKSITC